MFIKRKVIIRQPLPVDDDLDQIAVLAREGRPLPIKNIDMDIVRGETLPDRRLERINREGIPAQGAIRLRNAPLMCMAVRRCLEALAQAS